MFKTTKLVLFLSLFIVASAFAAPNEKRIEISKKYYPLKDSFVTNYGGPGRLKYFTVKVNLELADIKAREVVEYHEPLIRNTLTMYFSKQTNATIKSPSGQEILRQGALKEVQQALIKEVKNPVVEDLLFSNLNYQE